MTFEIEVGGRLRTVSIEALSVAAPHGGRFRLRIDGDVHEVDARVTDLGWSIVYDESGRTADVAVTERPGGEVLLQLPHVTVAALVDGRRFRRDQTGAAAAAGAHRVTAPMPGKVIRVLVHAGEDVAAGQGLVVVEAMKMENELRSPKAGRVKEVAVTSGQSVESGRLLAIVE